MAGGWGEWASISYMHPKLLQIINKNTNKLRGKQAVSLLSAAAVKDLQKFAGRKGWWGGCFLTGMQPIPGLVLPHGGEIKPLHQRVTGTAVPAPWPQEETPEPESKRSGAPAVDEQVRVRLPLL